ncbi:MAG: hypothetical protein M5U31_02405 [Acidimicrobiia bacterium]|nr:hypothetical protein [Acidimicrobiia bacterium]
MALALAVLLLCAACGIARPVPAVQGVASRPDNVTVLLFGDSLLRQAAPEIALQAEANVLPVDVVDKSQNGAGLLTTYGFDAAPRDILQAHLAEFEPDYVVVEFSGNHWFADILPGYEDLEYGSEEWFAAWWENYDLIVADIVAAGAQPLTVIPPPYGPLSPGAVTRTTLAEDYPGAASAHGSPTIDWREALASKDCIVWIAKPGGGLKSMPLCYADDLRDPEAGAIETVRAADMLHMSEAGAQRAAFWTVAVLSDLLA